MKDPQDPSSYYNEWFQPSLLGKGPNEISAGLMNILEQQLRNYAQEQHQTVENTPDELRAALTTLEGQRGSNIHDKAEDLIRGLPGWIVEENAPKNSKNDWTQSANAERRNVAGTGANMSFRRDLMRVYTEGGVKKAEIVDIKTGSTNNKQLMAYMIAAGDELGIPHDENYYNNLLRRVKVGYVTAPKSMNEEQAGAHIFNQVKEGRIDWIDVAKSDIEKIISHDIQASRRLKAKSSYVWSQGVGPEIYKDLGIQVKNGKIVNIDLSKFQGKLINGKSPLRFAQDTPNEKSKLTYFNQMVAMHGETAARRFEQLDTGRGNTTSGTPRPMPVHNYNPDTQQKVGPKKIGTGGTQAVVSAAQTFDAKTGAHPQYRAMLTQYTKFGKTRAELHNMVVDYSKAVGHTSFKIKDAERYIRSVLDVDRFDQLPNGQSVSPSQWGRTPGHKKSRHLTAVNDFPTDIKYADERKKWMMENGIIRKGDSLFSIKAATENSLLGRDANGLISTSPLVAKGSVKPLKKLAQQGAHTTVNMSGLRKVSGGMKESPGQQSPDEYNMATFFMSLGDSITPSGTFEYDPSVFGNMEQRIAKDFYPSIPGEEFSPEGLAGIGSQFTGDYQLHPDLAPVRGGKWGSTVVDSHSLSRSSLIGKETVEEHGQRFVINQSVDPVTGMLRIKQGGLKAIGSPRTDLGGITRLNDDGSRTPVQVDAVAQMKDQLSGAKMYWKAAEEYMGVDAVRAAIGKHYKGDLPEDYMNAGEAPLHAFYEDVESKGLFETIVKPEFITEEALFGSVDPSRIDGEPENLGNGVYKVNMKYNGIRAPFAFQASQDDPVRRRFLSFDDLQRYARNDPKAFDMIMKKSAKTRSAYHNIADSYVSSTGRKDLASRKWATANAETVSIKYNGETITGLNNIMAAAEAIVRDKQISSGKDPNDITPRAFNSTFMDLWQHQTKQFEVSDGSGGSAYLPSGSSVARWRATGSHKDEEVSGFISRMVDVLQSSTSGDQDEMSASLDEFFNGKKGIRSIVESKKFVQELSGAFLPKGMMQGSPGLGSFALAANEVSIPGARKGDQFDISRHPTVGDKPFRVSSVDDDFARSVGLDPRRIYTSMAIQQGRSGDWDGDLMYALLTGRHKKDKGAPLSIDQAIDMARSARLTGAGKLLEEHEFVSPLQNRDEELQSHMSKGRLAIQNRTSIEAYQSGLIDAQGISDLIGSQYNNMLKGMSLSATGSELAASEKLFKISHGISQRPAHLPPELQKIHTLLSADLGGYARDNAKNKFKRVGQNMASVMQDVISNLYDVKEQESGAFPYMSASELSSLLGGGDELTDHIRSLKNNPEVLSGQAGRSILSKAGGLEKVLGSLLGSWVGGSIANNHYKRNGKFLDASLLPGMTEEQVMNLTLQGQFMDDVITARRKTGDNFYDRYGLAQELTNPNNIERFSKGGTTNKQQLAIIGDNASGKESVVPEEHTVDLGNGIKAYDEDDLGKPAVGRKTEKDLGIRKLGDGDVDGSDPSWPSSAWPLRRGAQKRAGRQPVDTTENAITRARKEAEAQANLGKIPQVAGDFKQSDIDIVSAAINAAINQPQGGGTPAIPTNFKVDHNHTTTMVNKSKLTEETMVMLRTLADELPGIESDIAAQGGKPLGALGSKKIKEVIRYAGNLFGNFSSISEMLQNEPLGNEDPNAQEWYKEGRSLFERIAPLKEDGQRNTDLLKRGADLSVATRAMEPQYAEDAAARKESASVAKTQEENVSKALQIAEENKRNQKSFDANINKMLKEEAKRARPGEEADLANIMGYEAEAKREAKRARPGEEMDLVRIEADKIEESILRKQSQDVASYQQRRMELAIQGGEEKQLSQKKLDKEIAKLQKAEMKSIHSEAIADNTAYDKMRSDAISENVLRTDMMGVLSSHPRDSVASRGRAAHASGHAASNASPLGAGASPDVQDAITQLRDRKADYKTAYGQWSKAYQDHSTAMGSKQYSEARRLEKVMASQVDVMNGLAVDMNAVRPTVQDYGKALKANVEVLKTSIKSHEDEIAGLSSKKKEIDKQLKSFEDNNLEGTHLYAKAKLDGSLLDSAIAHKTSSLEAAQAALGKTEGDISKLSELSSSPGGATKRYKEAPASMMDNILGKPGNVNQLNAQAQNLALGYYMLMAPMIGLREKYLGSEYAKGGLSAAMGEGVPQSVIDAKNQQASIGKFQTLMGKGANNVFNPILNFAGGIAENHPDVAEGIGTATTAGTMALLLAGGAGLARKGISSAAGVQLGKDLTLGAAAGMGIKAVYSNPVTGGIATALGAWEASRMVGVNKNPSLLQYPLGLLNMGAQKVLDYREATGSLSKEEVEARRTEVNEQTARFAFYDVDAMKAEAKAKSQAKDQMSRFGVTQNVIDSIVAASKPFGAISEEQASVIGNQFAVQGGYTGVDEDSLTKALIQIITKAGKVGVDPTEWGSTIQKTVQGTSFAMGSDYQMAYQNFMLQADNTAGLDARGKAVKSTEGIAAQLSFSPSQAEDLADMFLKELNKTGSEVKAGRKVSKEMGLDSYSRSDIWYDLGKPEMAEFEKGGWKPKHLQETRNIEDRQRNEDFNRAQLIGQTQIDFQVQNLELENKFWDFKMKKRGEDFVMQNRQYDLSVKQMDLNIEKAEKQGKLQEENFKANYAINKKLFDLQTGWQIQDFDKQEYRSNVQRDWQQEDFAVNREQFTTTSGWQQEDFARAIRYSSGRDRLDLKRQQSRAMVQQGWKSDEMDRTEERASVQFGWSEEDLDTQRERWTIQRDLQREQMELSYEYQNSMLEFRDKDIALMKESRQLQIDQHALWLENYAIETPLILEQHQNEVAQTMFRIAMDQDALRIQKERFAEETDMIKWRRDSEDASLLWNYAMTVGFDVASKKSEVIAKYWEYIQNTLATSSQIAVGFGIQSQAQSGFGILQSPSQSGFGIQGQAQSGASYNFSQAHTALPSFDDADLGAAMDAIWGFIGELKNKTTLIVDWAAGRDNGLVHVDDLSEAYGDRW